MSEELRRLLPTWLIGPVERWLTPGLAALVIVVSLVLLIASALAVPWFARHLPADALIATRRRASTAGRNRPYKLPLRVAKNLVGAVLLLAGVVMLFVPGQGLLTMALGLVLLDLPGKRRLVRAVLGYAPVLAALNRLRARAGLPPLETR